MPASPPRQGRAPWGRRRDAAGMPWAPRASFRQERWSNGECKTAPSPLRAKGWPFGRVLANKRLNRGLRRAGSCSPCLYAQLLLLTDFSCS